MLLVTLTLTLIPLVFTRNASDVCQKRLFAVPGDPQLLYHSATVSAFVKDESTFCKYEIHTNPGHLIRLQIKSTLSGFVERREAQNCTDNYVHIGNDRMRVGAEMLTSYKLCGSILEEEIVSRGNYLWVIVQSLCPEPAVFSWPHIRYQAKLPIACDNTMFRCSPVQCVPKSSVCDGLADCDNARDEYCASRFGEVRSAAHKQQEPCFLCDDGTCISPTLPRYSLDWGKQFWYLCDGYSHCHDGTDERRDICVGLTGRSSALFRCVPKSVNVTAYLWKSALCDGTNDCEGAEDESRDLCQTEKEILREIKPISVIIPAAALLMVVFGAAICRAVSDKAQARRISVPMTCLDTAYVFTEFSNSPTTFELERSSSRSSRAQSQTEGETDDPDDPGDIGDLDLSDFDNDFDINQEDEITSITNDDATVNTLTTVPL